MSKNGLITILDKLQNEFGKSITLLSKSDNKLFIEDNKKLISCDDWSEKVSDNYASVDAIDYYLNNNNNLIINFFEFKNMDLKTEDNSRITLVQNYLENLKKCEHGCCIYYESLSKLCKKVPNDKLIQLKIKATETLYLLNKEFPTNQGDLLEVEKHYYVVSKVTQDYPLDSPNMCNTRRRSPSRQRFDFLFKLQPYPFNTAKCITEKTFKKLIYR